MKCNEVCELMPELALGSDAVAPDVRKHLESCAGCAEKLNEFRQTMAVLDEWQVPEPSPYFDVRLRARLREEAAHQSASWWQWIRKPALAVSLAVLMAISLLKNVPINKYVIALDPASPPEDWSERDPRASWKNWNQIRVVLSMAALVANLAGAAVLL